MRGNNRNDKRNMKHVILGFGRDVESEGVLLGKAGVSVPKPILLAKRQK